MAIENTFEGSMAAKVDLLEKAGIQGEVLLPKRDEVSFLKNNKRLISGFAKAPAVIVRPRDSEDVSRAVRWAVENHVRIAIRCGGHIPASSVDDGLVLDMRSINHARVDDEKLIAGGGCLWDDVYPVLAKHKRITAGGGAWPVGIGGFLTGGGHSWLSSKYGAGVDQIEAATVVIATGDIVKCDSVNSPDLFWAIRGGSSQFGVVTEFVLKTYPAPGELFCGAAVYDGKYIKSMCAAIQRFSATRDPHHTFALSIHRAPPNSGMEALLIITPFAEADEAKGREIFKDFLTSPDLPILKDDLWVAPTFVECSHAADDVLLHPAPPLGASIATFYTQTWPGMIEDAYEKFVKFYQENPDKKAMALFECHRIYRPDSSATAYHSPEVRYSYAAFTCGYHDHKDKELAESFMDQLSDGVRTYELQNTGTEYGLMSGSSFQGKPEDVWWQNYPRLRKLKAKYDPNQVFGLHHHIEPDFTSA